MKRKLEILINIAIISAAVLIAVLLIGRSRAGKEKTDQSPPMRVLTGNKLEYPGIDWAGNRRTVLVMLTRECQFCLDSAPFYQRLRNELNGVGRLVVITPDPVSIAGPFLRDRGIVADDLRQNAPSALGIRIVPAVIAVNEAGIVTGMWNGKLSDRQQQDVVDQLHSNRTDATAKTSTEMDPAELRRLIENGVRVQLVDIRDRADYRKGHIPGAKNIPVDELEARAGNELSRSTLVVAYCECTNDELSEIAREIVNSRGFQKTAILRGGFTAWRNAGFDIDK